MREVITADDGKGSGEVSKIIEQEERLAWLEEFREDDCFAVKVQCRVLYRGLDSWLQAN